MLKNLHKVIANHELIHLLKKKEKIHRLLKIVLPLDSGTPSRVELHMVGALWVEQVSL